MLNTNENIIEKLEYIGLDLNNIPDFLSNFEGLNYKPTRNYNEKNYKVYKYVDVKDIEIFITPINRLTDISERYAKAIPICAYLKPTSKDDIEKHTQFLKMLKSVEIEGIKSIEEQQKSFKNEIPYKVKYSKDYLWQIHYSETTNKYFMLASTNDDEYEALFYLLKKQLSNKNEKIYVPICYSNYSNEYLYSSEIIDIENELWFFTKKWPEIYETYDRENNMSLNIVGNMFIHNTLISYYKVELKSKEEANKFYKLLKAIFILQTEVSHYYKFNIKLDKNGNINFYESGKKITYGNLKDYIKEKYVSTVEKNVKKIEERIMLEKEIQSLKDVAKKLDLEYIEKEKQISTYLECKKTFIGKIKYFFKYKKKKAVINDREEIQKENKQTIHYCKRENTKELYTVEELLEISKEFVKEEANVKKLNLDYNALKKRIEMMNKKIENAVLYIQEIDKHKKSIFEFWKFTNTEGMQQLSEGIEPNRNAAKLKKSFDIATDFEEISKQIDNTQRTSFSKIELDSVFIATTKQLEDLNLVLNNQEIPEEHLEDLKEELKIQNPLDSFDVFGSIIDSQNQIKTLGNTKHREIEKNKFSILKITSNTTIEEYTEKINEILNNILKILERIKFNLEIPVYSVSNELPEHLSIFHIKSENLINEFTQNNVNLYKLNLKEDTKCIGLTNSVYYENMNKTLPFGMDINDGVLLDMDKLNLQLKSENEEYIIIDSNKTGEIKSIKINIFDYDV